MADVRGELETYVKRWYEIFPAGDAALLAALYTPDARLLLANLPRAAGNQDIGAFLAGFTRYATLDCRYEVTDVDVIGDDLAVVTGSAWVDALPKTGGAPIKDASRFLMVMKRSPTSGEWLCHYDMSQHTPDVKPAP
jgi:uncharacterized protein (TIGR02246 family)